MLAPHRFPLVDAATFHRDTLPARLAAGNGCLAATAARAVGARRPLAVTIEGGPSFSYVPTDTSVEVREGVAPDAAEVTMSADHWSDWCQELHTAFGLLYGGFARGALDHLVAWEPVVRAMYAGKPVYDPSQIDLTGLELGRAFSLADDPAAIHDHFARAGFVHVRGVFDAAEIGSIGAEVERLRADARQGDDRSWWTLGPDGAPAVCRLTFVDERAPSLGALFRDDRLRTLVDAARGTVEMVPIPDRNDGPSVVIKNPGAHEGLTDLPWHVDCGLGGHPILCPAINLGIQLDAARADNGQLHFLAGSHRTTAFHLTPDVLADRAYPTVAITTEPGDVTLHLGDTLHWAPAPRAAGGPGRRALYLSWGNPLQFDVLEPRTGYNDLVLRSGQGNRVRTVDEQLTAR